MWSRSRIIVGAVAAAGLALGGCSGSADGSAQSISSTEQTVSTGQSSSDSSTSQEADSPGSSEENLPQNGAPAVKTPLGASLLKDDSCNAMTDKQAQQFPGEFADAKSDDKGYCKWTYDKDLFHLGSLTGELETDNSKGLSKYYGNVDQDVAKVEEIEPVSGYPAIMFDIGKTDSGVCSVKVGVRDDLIYTSLAVLDSEHPSYDEPCEVAREFAGVVVDNLKEAQ